MKRTIDLCFFDFDEHPDLSFLKEGKLSVRLFNKGQVRQNGKDIQPVNCAYISLTNDLPDSYDDRIEEIIGTLGGEKAVENLISIYRAKQSDLILGIPSKTSRWPEDGYFSLETIQKVSRLKLGLQLYYI